jgi:hypothetical protein
MEAYYETVRQLDEIRGIYEGLLVADRYPLAGLTGLLRREYDGLRGLLAYGGGNGRVLIMLISAYFDRFEIEMTVEQAKSASHQGRCDDDVKQIVNELRPQLDKIEPELIAAELKEYGAWDEIELSDHEANLNRIVWIAAGNINEEV